MVPAVGCTPVFCNIKQPNVRGISTLGSAQYRRLLEVQSVDSVENHCVSRILAAGSMRSSRDNKVSTAGRTRIPEFPGYGLLKIYLNIRYLETSIDLPKYSELKGIVPQGTDQPKYCAT